MRAFLLERTGPPSVLRLRDLPDPAARAGEVVVRVRAIGVNYAEVLSRRGLYGWAPKRPYVLGMEAAGEIEGVGDGVDPARLGQRVIVGTKFGCYAEKVRVPAARALPAIDAFSMEENAAFPVNYLTAWVALFEMARVRPTDVVLVNAAAGGVGTAAVQLASRYGCTVVGAVGSAAKIETVRRLGAAHAALYQDLAAAVHEASFGRGADVVLEVLGGDVYRASLRALAPLGRLVVVGFAGLAELRTWNPLSWWRAWRGIPRANVMRMLETSTGVLSTHLGYLLADEALVGRLTADLASFTLGHGIRPVVGATFPFERMADAHALMESRASTGKIVVTL